MLGSRVQAAVALLALVGLAGCSREPPTTPRPAPPAAAADPAAAVAITFRVAVPTSTPAGGTVYLAGDFQGWNPGSAAHALTLQPDGRWTITLGLEAGLPIQFKFTRGSWATVEKGPNGEEIANRALTVQAGTFDFTVARWADQGTITGDVTTFSHAPFLSGRRVWVYLPPGYAEEPMRRYPVLYMHDGQNLFDVRTSFAGEWKVDEACESLIGSGELAPLIVVGVDNGGASRIQEYTPWPAAGYGGGGADAYLAALRTVLKPEIDRRYRTLTGPNHTFMAGSSLGGLLSAYAGWSDPGTWGRVAAVSPSYRWDDEHLLAWAATLPKPALARFYQDMGTIEAGSTTDANGNGIDDYIESLRAMRALALAKGFVEGEDLMSIEAPGHTHSETYWALRTPNLLRYLVGAQTASVP
jgi:pullulanase